MNSARRSAWCHKRNDTKGTSWLSARPRKRERQSPSSDCSCRRGWHVAWWRRVPRVRLSSCAIAITTARECHSFGSQDGDLTRGGACSTNCWPAALASLARTRHLVQCEEPGSLWRRRTLTRRARPIKPIDPSMCPLSQDALPLRGESLHRRLNELRSTLWCVKAGFECACSLCALE